MTAIDLINKLYWIEGNLTIKNGILWLPDGTAIDLIEFLQNMQFFFSNECNGVKAINPSLDFTIKELNNAKDRKLR